MMVQHGGLSRCVVWVGITVLGFRLSNALAASATFIPVADTTLIAAAAQNNLGGAPFFNTGVTGTGFPNHGLFRFDFSGQIPAMALVQNLTLELTVVFTPPPQLSTDGLFGMHRILRPWGEGMQVPENPFSPGLGTAASPGEATWTHRYAGGMETWSVPGGEAGVDYAAEASSYIYVSGVRTYQLDTSPAMVQDAQYWVDNPESNYGWMLVPTSLDERYTARRFGSREDPGAAPFLSIDFEVVPEPSTSLLGLGLAAVLARLGIRPGRLGNRIDR